MRNHLGAVFAVGALLIVLPNCSGTYGDYCQAEADCEGGNEADVDACIEEARGAEDVADAYECGDPYEKYVDCVTERSTCKDDNGRKRFTSGDACKGLEDAYEACQAAASAKGKGK